MPLPKPSEIGRENWVESVYADLQFDEAHVVEDPAVINEAYDEEYIVDEPNVVNEGYDEEYAVLSDDGGGDAAAAATTAEAADSDDASDGADSETWGMSLYGEHEHRVAASGFTSPRHQWGGVGSSMRDSRSRGGGGSMYASTWGAGSASPSLRQRSMMHDEAFDIVDDSEVLDDGQFDEAYVVEEEDDDDDDDVGEYWYKHDVYDGAEGSDENFSRFPDEEDSGEEVVANEEEEIEEIEEYGGRGGRRRRAWETPHARESSLEPTRSNDGPWSVYAKYVSRRYEKDAQVWQDKAAAFHQTNPDFDPGYSDSGSGSDDPGRGLSGGGMLNSYYYPAPTMRVEVSPPVSPHNNSTSDGSDGNCNGNGNGGWVDEVLASTDAWQEELEQEQAALQEDADELQGELEGEDGGGGDGGGVVYNDSYVARPGLTTEEESLLVLSCNIENMDAEVTDFIAGLLLSTGAALDTWTSPIHVRQGRPGFTLNILCRHADAPRIRKVLFSETTTPGMRSSRVQHHFPSSGQTVFREEFRGGGGGGGSDGGDEEDDGGGGDDGEFNLPPWEEMLDQFQDDGSNSIDSKTQEEAAGQSVNFCTFFFTF